MRKWPLLLLASSLWAQPSIQSLYSSLDPLSLTQNMAFYELYPDTKEGKKALANAWHLLRHESQSTPLPLALAPSFDIQAIVSLVTRQPYDEPVKLQGKELKLIQTLARHFPNKQLKGAHVWTREEVLALPSEEVDLCRGLLIEQFDGSETFEEDILQYEASLDLMALQILARLPENASGMGKVREINRYIFQEMQFRFPPHSLYAKDIDLYTFLPSVLDSRQGVCLGVSILYLCLAQRLDLPLEIVTPPGHIYVRYNDGERIVNIETTARGINLPCETYLGINTRKLQLRELKDVIGMAFFNQASVFWGRQDYKQSVKTYEKALPYVGDDPLVNMFLGMNYLFVGREREGRALLTPLKDFTFDHAVAPETFAADYLNGKVNVDGLKKVFMHVDETRESILEKQKELFVLVKKFPKFRAGILQLAISYLQLGRYREGLATLKKYHAVDPNDPTIEYYLAVVSAERRDFQQAWQYLHNAEEITTERDHFPKALRSLRSGLRTKCPDPL